MADSTTKSNAFLTWAGGILATVIASVAIYYFTRPAPPAPVAQVGLDGFVADSVTQKPIPNAIVNVNLGSTLASQPTDSEGRYSFIMNTTSPPPDNQSVNVNVLAGGYQPYTATIPLTSDDTLAELPILPINAPATAPSPSPGQPTAAAPVETPTKRPPILRVPKNFQKRKEAAALKAK